MKQNQFDILFNMINDLGHKMDTGLNELNNKVDNINNNVDNNSKKIDEVITILKNTTKHCLKMV